MAAPDSLQTVLDLLSTNWTDSNTNSKTPTFDKITNIKRLDFRNNQDFVLALRATSDIAPAGIGESNKHEFDLFKLDIRTLGSDQEQHWLNVQEEIKRILQDNKINPLTNASKPVINVSIVEYDGQGVDLSDKTRHLWRIVVPIQMLKYNVSR